MKLVENIDDFAPLSEEELEKFIQYLDSGAELRGEPAFGSEIEFMERNGFDVSWIAGEIVSYANDLDSPLAIYDDDGAWIPNGRSINYCRSLVLQIRDYHRKKWGLPPLSAEEKSSWQFDTLSSMVGKINDRWDKWHEESRAIKGGLSTYHLTDEDVKKSAIYIKEKYPEIARYIAAIRNISKQQGYDGLSQVGRLWLIGFFVEDAVKSCTNIKPGYLTTEHRKVEDEIARII